MLNEFWACARCFVCSFFSFVCSPADRLPLESALSALSYLKSFCTLTKFCAVLIEFCWQFLRLHVVIVAASSCKKLLTCGKQFEYVLTAFFKRKILIGPQVCFVHQLDSRPPFRRSSPSRQPRITPTICFLLSLSWCTWVEKLASFPNAFLIDDHSETEGIFLNHAVALNRAGVIFHCPDEHWNASFINPPRTCIHTVGFHFFIALLVGLLKKPSELEMERPNQQNQMRC